MRLEGRIVLKYYYTKEEFKKILQSRDEERRNELKVIMIESVYK